MNRLATLVLLMGVLLLACGKNKGTPQPDKTPDPSGDGRRVSKFADATIAENADWRVDLRWNQPPKFSDEELLEITGTVDFYLADGSRPKKVENVSFEADMPEMAHGTGNNKPTMTPVKQEPGYWEFGNLIFTMTGLWRIRVSATLDGKPGIWSTNVDVP